MGSGVAGNTTAVILRERRAREERICWEDKTVAIPEMGTTLENWKRMMSYNGAPGGPSLHLKQQCNPTLLTDREESRGILFFIMRYLQGVQKVWVRINIS